MSMLFDISPDEPLRARSSRSRARTGRGAKTETPAPEKVTSIYKGIAPKAIKALGRLDHVHECADSRCRGSAHDIIHEDGGEWLIQCAFCNTSQWVPVIKGHLQEKSQDEFVFRDGRFSGLTISEAWDQPRGEDYVRWCADSHKRPAVKAAAKTWLDAREQQP